MVTQKMNQDKKEEFKPEVPIYNVKGNEVGRYELNREIFTGRVHHGALHQAVVIYNANQRQGTASTKTTSDVSGGGKKPWAQKGTGRARHGSTRSPLWRGGGKIFGPHPRDYYMTIPKKIKTLALISAINSKLIEGRLVGIDALSLEEPKTKRFREIMEALKLKGKTLFVLETIEDDVRRASRNLPGARLKTFREINTVDVMLSDKVVVSKGALDKLQERLKVR